MDNQNTHLLQGEIIIYQTDEGNTKIDGKIYTIATQFRKWASERLKEYIIKGFAMDDDRLKQLGRVQEISDADLIAD